MYITLTLKEIVKQREGNNKNCDFFFVDILHTLLKPLLLLLHFFWVSLCDGVFFSCRDKFKHRSVRVPIEQWSKPITLEFSPRLPKTSSSNPEEGGKDCGKSTVVENPLQPSTAAARCEPVVAEPRDNLSSSPSGSGSSSGPSGVDKGSSSEIASAATTADDAADGRVSKGVDKKKRVSPSSKGRETAGGSSGGVGGGSSGGNERLHGKKKGSGGGTTTTSGNSSISSTAGSHGGIEESGEDGVDEGIEVFELPSVLMPGATPLDARLASVRALLEGEGVGVGFRFGEHMCLLAALQAFCEEWGPLRKR